MEPNSIEKQFREKLNQHTIQPSSKAWDRLDAMLSVEEQRPKRNFKWLSVAAAFLGFTLIGIFILNQQNTIEISTPNNQVVIEDKANSHEIIKQPKVENNIAYERIVEVATTVKSTKNNEIKVIEIDPKKDNLLDNQQEKKELVVENQKEEIISNKYIDANSLLAEVEKGEKAPPKLTISKPSVKVDANSLLSSAEKEVNESFRDKVIQSINKNYKSVKSTLANRNTE